MTIFPSQLRRAITQAAIRQGMWATARLPIDRQRMAVRSIVTLVGSVPALRQRVRENMRLALGPDVPAKSESLYFRRVGWFLAGALSTFHHGIDATPIPDEIKFDDSIFLLDAAVAEGRGVVIASPHWSGHELAAAVVSRRHPTALLVRQAPSTEQMTRKLEWYKALGIEIVLRPRRASAIKDAVGYLSILKTGKVLAITPDLLAAPGQGVEAQIFGRRARLYGGAFALAISTRAPVMLPFFTWQSDSSFVLSWRRGPALLDSTDRDFAIRANVQDWCRWFEERLRANPENWLFWLDKRWGRFLHQTPNASGFA